MTQINNSAITRNLIENAIIDMFKCRNVFLKIIRPKNISQSISNEITKIKHKNKNQNKDKNNKEENNKEEKTKPPKRKIIIWPS